MEKCKVCGKELEPGMLFCGECGSAVEIDTENHGALSYGITLGTDEIIVKRYTIGRYTWGQGVTEVIITNKRVIRYEDSNWLGMQNNTMDEINLEAVHGVATRLERSLSIKGMVIALLLLFIGTTSNAAEMIFGFPFKLICICAAVFVGWMSFKPALTFYLYGAVGGPALFTGMNYVGKWLGKNYSSVIFQFKPTEETIIMLKQIGACIYDLKTMGESAIGKWKKGEE